MKYGLLWPTNAQHLVVANSHGFGPIDFSLYPNAQIYNQPDSNQPGFNPNEEHALFAPDPAGGGTLLFALRSDLNHTRPGVVPDSEPYVLLKYLDPATQLWRFKTFQVLAQEAPYYFVYPGIAGTQIQPPYPLSLLPQPTNSYAASGPWWQDVAGPFLLAGRWRSRRAIHHCHALFLSVAAGFWYDLNNDGTNDVPDGTAITWLSGLSANQNINQPIDATYMISWPGNVPTLAVGETLYGAAHGLPDVQDMASAQVVYDSLSATVDDTNNSVIYQLARLFDPMSPRMVTVTSTTIFSNINTSIDLGTGTTIFPDLPYYLRVRLY
ncbi:MAG: hypothetical protein WDM76_10330 [Limisphaerales bacterium]